MFLGLIKTLRPKQWIKNSFVGVPLFFAQQLTDLDALLRVLAGFALFCLISGCVYVINDIVDVEKDKAHPTKQNRPIPSGELPVAVARNFVIVVIPAALGLGFLLAPLYCAALAGYLALNLAYCFKTKNLPYLDVISIAAGFVLRLLAGAFVIDVEPSPWLLGVTALLSMFLGFGKRTHELASAGEAAEKQRASLRYYRLDALRWTLHILAVLVVVVYAMYTQSDHVAATFGSAPLIYTLPFPIIGILRFIHLVVSRHDAESPTEEMLKDPLFMGNFGLWLIATASILYLL